MATKENYDDATEVLTRFITLIKETNSIFGMSYSFSARKAQIDYLSKKKSVMIRQNELFIATEGFGTTQLVRVKSESAAFQLSCVGDYFCDKEMEDLITEMFTVYNSFITSSLNVGIGWES